MYYIGHDGTRPIYKPHSRENVFWHFSMYFSKMRMNDGWKPADDARFYPKKRYICYFLTNFPPITYG